MLTVALFSSGSRGGGGLGGLTPPFRGCFLCFFACQYIKIPTDLDPNPPPFEEFWPRTPPPPFKEFLDPPLLFIKPPRSGDAKC